MGKHWPGPPRDTDIRVAEALALSPASDMVWDALDELVKAAREFVNMAAYEIPAAIEEEFVAALDHADAVLAEAP